MLSCRASLAFSRPPTRKGRQKIGRICLPYRYSDLRSRDGQICSGLTSNASAINLSPLGQRRLRALVSVEDASPALRESAASDVPRFFQCRNNVGGMPVLLHHAVTSSINFTPSDVRSQRGAFISAAK